MRKFVILAALGPVLALAGCAENTGWNPNYSAVQNGTGYAKYAREREAALRGSAPIPRTIPGAIAGQGADPGRYQRRRRDHRDADGRGGRDDGRTCGPAQNRPGRGQSAGDHQRPLSGFDPGAGALCPSGTAKSRHHRLSPDGRFGDCGGAALLGLCLGRYRAARLYRGGRTDPDPKGMDPDGDGFVCGWDPRPVRNAPGL
ncbi:MAG: hypothetical protein U1E55_09385 [Paracoccus sp. (in: a-proteobacteria)]